MDIAKLDLLKGHVRGQRGHPSERDYPQLDKMALYMARDASLSKTDAAWMVLNPQVELKNALPVHISTVARLRRKFGQHPWIFRSRKDYYESKVRRVVNGAKPTASLLIAAPPTRQQFGIMFLSKFPLCWEVYDDPRVTEAIDEIWEIIRPSTFRL